jgi:hypothetical protein
VIQTVAPDFSHNGYKQRHHTERRMDEKGSYLRTRIQRLGLDKNKGYGPIYRLVYDGMQPADDIMLF